MSAEIENAKSERVTLPIEGTRGETGIASLLVAHELHTVQAVKPFRTLWRCLTCGYEVDARSMRHSEAQAEHQAAAMICRVDAAWAALVDAYDEETR